MVHLKSPLATQRFSNTIEYYAKYRPSYPPEILQLLTKECGFTVNTVIADIGSGTGIFAKLLLEQGYKVFAIEPNAEMRAEAEQLLAHQVNFISINASAEATSLEDNSVDCITAATAFHWFDRNKTKPEFKRILKPGGWCFLIWNLRMTSTSLLMQEYENLLLKYGIDYKAVAAEKISEEVVRQFFEPHPLKIVTFPNKQRFDWEGFQGRLLSTSYSPKPGQPQHEEMLQAAKKLFAAHQQQGYVEFSYTTKCYYGRW